MKFKIQYPKNKKFVFVNTLLLVFFYFTSGISNAQQIAILKYDGGGDWYANPTALPNLITFSNKNIHTKIDKKPTTVDASSSEIYNFPIVFLTGHGNIFFSEEASQNLRNYLISGGFLHISDNYGLDPYIRKEMKKVFPELEFLEIPMDHDIYHQNIALLLYQKYMNTIINLLKDLDCSIKTG